MVKCKITVLKRMFNQDFADEYCQKKIGPCSVFNEGQEYIYDHHGEGNKPENFCEYAWNDIFKYVLTYASKGYFSGWMKDDRTLITCCTDGIRPVVFKIERIDDE